MCGNKSQERKSDKKNYLRDARKLENVCAASESLMYSDHFLSNCQMDIGSC